MKLDIDKIFIIDHLDWGSFDDLYPGYSHAEKVGGDCYFASEKQLNNYCEDVLGLFQALASEDPVLIYRSIQVDSIAQIDREMLGEHWSFDLESARNFAKYNLWGSVFLVRGETSPENIDWKKSIVQYLHFSGRQSDEDENELIVLDASEVRVVIIEQIIKKKVNQSKLFQNIYQSKGISLIIAQVEKRLEVKFYKIGRENLRKKRSDSLYIRKNPHLNLYALSYNILDYTWESWLEKTGNSLFDLPDRKIKKAPIIKFYFDSRSGEESLGLVYIEIYTPKFRDSSPTYTYETYGFGIVQLINQICKDLKVHVYKKSELEKEYESLLTEFISEGGEVVFLGKTVKYIMEGIVEYVPKFDYQRTNQVLKELLAYKKYFHGDVFTVGEDEQEENGEEYNPYRVASGFIPQKNIDDILKMVDWDLYRRRKYYPQLRQPWVNRVYASTVEMKCKSSKYNKNGKIYTQKILFKDFIVLAKDQEITIADSVKYL
jgi:hypothetical protein